jgi:nucleoside-diphosphate-sugar epimerase
MATLFCFGLGYCARHMIAQYGARFARVAGTLRTAEKASAIASDGIAGRPVDALVFDGTSASAAVVAALAEADALLVSIAPDEGGDPVLACCAEAIARAPRLASIVYLSTIGVYGDHGGAWIDETNAATPVTARSRERLLAEQAFAALGVRSGKPVAILRLAGIYGPGQNALTQLAGGTARRIVKPGQVFNRIHVADIAQAIDAAFARRFDGIANVTDGEPAPPGDQIEFAAKLLGIAPPPLLSLDEAKRTLSPFLMSFYDGCARVRNDKLKSALGVTLRYPDYRAGLQALLDDGFEAPY